MLDPSCKGNHLVKGCPKTTNEEAEKLLNEYIGNRPKKRKKGQLSSLRTELSSSTIFKGAFCDDAVQIVIKADYDSNPNLIPSSVLKYIKASDSSILESKLDVSQYYGTFTKRGKQVICSH